MNRIDTTLARLRESGKKALVPYIVAGDPALDVTLPTLHALVKAGADIIELGVPFSDPMAEGPVIQKGHERALANGMSLRGALRLVEQFRAVDQQTPIVLMGYANPIEKMGYEKFAEAAKAAGVDGVLTVDLPPEEARELNTHLAARGIVDIFLIAPTTTTARVKMIVALASGYLYYVSLKGVTGAGHLDVASVDKKMKEIKSLTNLPVCVGFGIKDADSARAVSQMADGVVVGSVLVAKMADCQSSGEHDPNVIAGQVSAIIAAIRSAIDQDNG